MQGYTKGLPLDTDGSLSNNSDQLVASQKAVKTYVDARVAALPVRLYVGSGLTGAVNDSNATYTTSVNSASARFSLAVVDGIVDFAATWSGTTLTTSSAPHSGVSLIYWS